MVCGNLENNLIWENFPLGGSTVGLICNDQLLGSVPRVNLFKLKKGAIFRFGGKRSETIRVENWQLRVKSTGRRGEEVRLNFSRDGPYGLDVFVAVALWCRLFEAAEASIFTTADRWRDVGRFAFEVRKAISGADAIPYEKTRSKRRYFTFAGAIVNLVIQHWLDSAAADDLSVKTEKAVDWSSIPSSPANLRESAQNATSFR